MQHHHPPLAASGRIGGLDDVEVVRIAAEHLAQPEQQGGAERRPDRPVDQRDRRDQEPHRLGTQFVGQRERGPPVGVGLLPLPAPAPVPGLGPLPDAALGQRDDAAVAAGVEQRGRDLLPRDHAGGAAPLAGTEVQPPDVGRPQHLGAEGVAVELPGGAHDVVALGLDRGEHGEAGAAALVGVVVAHRELAGGVGRGPAERQGGEQLTGIRGGGGVAPRAGRGRRIRPDPLGPPACRAVAPGDGGRIGVEDRAVDLDEWG